MDATAQRQPLFFLIDDDPHSARFLMRKLENACGERAGIRCEWFGDMNTSQNMLADLPSKAPEERPDLVIVDIKSHSQANEKFIAAISPAVKAANVILVAMTHKTDSKKQKLLLNAGAEKIFERHAKLEKFETEVTKIIRFSGH